MWMIIQSARNSSSILLRSRFLISFIKENVRSVVDVERGRVNTKKLVLKSNSSHMPSLFQLIDDIMKKENQYDESPDDDPFQSYKIPTVKP